MAAPVLSRLAIAGLAYLALGACGGDDGGGSPSPSPTPTPSSGPPSVSNLAPAPFGITATTQLAVVGWQETHQTAAAPIVALASEKFSLGWSASEKTYTAALADFGSGRLVYTFPGNNPAAFSLVDANGAKLPVYVSMFLQTSAMGRLNWQSADGVQPFVFGGAHFGIPTGALPATGKRVFVTDTGTTPQSVLLVDFATRKVSGTLTTAYTDGWGPYPGLKVQAVLDPAELNADGTFTGVIGVAGAPSQGELRGRLFGGDANSLGVYWNGPAKWPVWTDDSSPLQPPWLPWRAVMGYAACTSNCPL